MPKIKKPKPKTELLLTTLNWFQRNELAEKLGGSGKLAERVNRSLPTVRRWLRKPDRGDGSTQGRSPKEPSDYEMELLLKLWKEVMQ